MKQTSWLVFIAMFAASACKEKYVPQLRLEATSFLVVEGFINSGNGPTIITLSRSTKVYDTAAIVYENGAVVAVVEEGLSGNMALQQTGSGVYSGRVNLNPGKRYALYIAANGKVYHSDFSEVRKTPDIDSVFWLPKSDGVQTYLDTHDPSNKTRYYQWKYDETWEFHSKFISSLKLLYRLNKPIDVEFKDPSCFCNDTSIYKCWKNISLTSILVGSSEKLSQDLISTQQMTFIPPRSQQLSVLYSVNVKQYALSEKAFRFLQQMKRNTEQLGTIFDSQPSENSGNMHCVNDALEPVIGFIEVSEEKQKRLFISNAQVPNWRYDPGCPDEVKVLNQPDSLSRYGAGLVPTVPAEYGGNSGSGIKYVNFADPFCVNCTFTGSNKKPAFWP
jgi:hypothetical protein